MNIDLQDLLNLSEKVGSDPSLVQAAGGNTSIVIDDTMWIKASGTWLMNANKADIMVPVNLPPLLNAIRNNDLAAERAQAFVDQDNNPGGLRPSIETTVHAVLPQKVVVHVHCINTIAIAVRRDAIDVLQERLSRFNWAYVPYIRPGLPLSQAIANAIDTTTDVVILGNHGLVVAAETVAEAERLLHKVCAALAPSQRDSKGVNSASDSKSNSKSRTSSHNQTVLQSLANGSDYRLPASDRTHHTACDSSSLRHASGGSLYPDHVIFLGVGVTVAQEGETANDVCARVQESGQPTPALILFPGIGALIHQTADAAKEAMAQCLADVTAIIEPDAPLNYLTNPQNHELLNWDAEQYRQAMNKQ
jgi:rhamnose utilization protein RhaD (predicted bifunctional aldolase and dehydrogenase)